MFRVGMIGGGGRARWQANGYTFCKETVAGIVAQIRNPQNDEPIDLGTSQGQHLVTDVLAINEDVVPCLKSGAEPELSSRRALQSSELIFATYESARRRAQIALPIEIDDNPFLTMLDDGTLVRS